jgi:pimeloyl-ACP methyl ester carboxylesterase
VPADDDALFVRRGGGHAGPVLLLLHGLGATGAVWDGLGALLPDHWPGPWVAPDLPGHGRSAPLARYSFGALAAVAPLVEPGPRRPPAPRGPPGRPRRRGGMTAWTP